MKPRESLSERIQARQTLMGFMQTQPNPALVEMAAQCGYDFLFLDCEHGLFSDMDLLQALQLLSALNVASLVRLKGHDAQAVGRLMDLGADVIVVPNVTSAAEARMLARAMHYPPAGTRGFAASAHRVTRYGMDAAVHVKDPRAGVSLLVIIESEQGVANVEEIVAVEGIDGVIIGPSDLSAGLGALGDYSSAVYREAVARVERAVATRGKTLGTAPHGDSTIEALIARGHRLCIIGADMPLIREAMSAQVMQAKSALATPKA
jgi:4-hydroxy-2-oxoheptanedioate aldolase